MLFRRNLTKYATLFLLLLIIFQFISGYYANAEHMDGYVSEQSMLLSRYAAQFDTTPLNKDNRRTQFHFSLVRFSNNSLMQILILHSFQGKDLYDAALNHDFHNINKINPHCFNGSKYKEQLEMMNG